MMLRKEIQMMLREGFRCFDETSSHADPAEHGLPEPTGFPKLSAAR